MRTFRVLRLFGRLHSFRRIISALGAALIPVTTAFTIVLLMVSVFAIMGVFLFQTKAPEFFGSFSASFFTMFTISTVDGWVDVVYVAAPETLDWGTPPPLILCPTLARPICGSDVNFAGFREGVLHSLHRCRRLDVAPCDTHPTPSLFDARH